jgi:Hsp20/alpha crystallin family
MISNSFDPGDRRRRTTSSNRRRTTTYASDHSTPDLQKTGIADATRPPSQHRLDTGSSSISICPESITRQLLLGGSLDTDRLEADYDQGVLTLRIPVAEAAKPRRVEITKSAGGQRAIVEGQAARTS